LFSPIVLVHQRHYGGGRGMQPNDYQPQDIPFTQSFTPYTTEQLQQWQQQYSPDTFEQMQQHGTVQQPVTPEMLHQWQLQVYQWQMQQMQLQQMQGVPASTSNKKLKRINRTKQPRRQRRGLVRIIQLVVILGAITFIGWFILDNMRGSGSATAVIEIGALGITYRGDALIVRNEVAYDDEGVQSIEYVALEGSTVNRGNVVCYVYSTGYSNKEMITLQDYRDQIKNYQQTLLKSEIAPDPTMTRLQSAVVDQGLGTRNLVQGARGNLINQEKILDMAITQRQNHFRSKYSKDMRLNRLFDDESTQKQRIDSWIKQRAANRDSIISFYTDGYEHALTPEQYDKYAPNEVRAMINGQRPEGTSSSRGRTDIYRLVDKKNYDVLMLIRDTAWNPVEDVTYKLMLEQFSNTVVDARVKSFTRSGGELLVRLRVEGDVTPVLYMRTCQAELREHTDSLMVPVAAIYEHNGVKGVVLVDGEQQIFVPVNIMQQDRKNAYISAILTGVLKSGQVVKLFY